MKNKFSKIFLLFIILVFVIAPAVYAQSCSTLKEIFENSNYCDKNEVFIHGKVYELLNELTLKGSRYVYGFQITDDGQYIVRVVSKDDMVLVKDAEVVINGRYYKKLYADGLNFDDTIVASGKDIKVIITAEELFNEILRPWGVAMNKKQLLKRWTIILAILIPLFSIGAFALGYILYKRKQIRGITFEGYIESLFAKNEWRIEQSNAFKKLGRWVESYSNPDFVFIHRRTGKRLAVECKYKNSFPEGGKRIIWANEDQIENYKNFSQKQNISVFVIIGVGGRPKNPKRIFLVPLTQIKYPDVRIDYLEKFERDPKKYFSLDSRSDII